MKKITLLIMFAISAISFSQNAANASATADIVSPIVVAKTVDMNFGKVSNNAAGTVTIASDGTVGGLTQIGTTNPKAAQFNITVADGYNYVVTIPLTDQILKHTDNTTTMPVNNFSYEFVDATNSTTGTGSAQGIRVGADLNVVAGQKTGTYSGSFEVSVAYQ
jgi:hypothetical protein